MSGSGNLPLDYEALAEKKRKALADMQGSEGSSKKARKEDISEGIMDEIMQTLNCGRRRKSSKKRGRRKGRGNKLSPQIQRIVGDATLHYGNGRFKEAISVLKEGVQLEPKFPHLYHMLGLSYKALGDNKRAFQFYIIAGLLKPKDPDLWKLLFTWSIEQENVSLTCHCLSKAIMADPTDISLRYLQASLYDELGDYQKAAESYEQIQQISPDNVEALKSGAKLYQKCGQIERSFAILEGYLEGHQDEADLSVINLLVSMLMQNNAYERALQQIEQAHAIYYSGKELPINLKTKSGICHIHLGDIEKAEDAQSLCFDWNPVKVHYLSHVSIYVATIFSIVLQSIAHDHADLVTEVADTFMTLGHVNSALKYYNMLENDDGIDDDHILELKHRCRNLKVMNLQIIWGLVTNAEQDHLHHKIAQCYISTGEKVLAIKFLRKVACLFQLKKGSVQKSFPQVVLDQNKSSGTILGVSGTHALVEHFPRRISSNNSGCMCGEILFGCLIDCYEELRMMDPVKLGFLGSNEESDSKMK
ncbi:hypothetical protein GOBAR_DD31138 [Gossypium barbadense]|nr:hypothetical protein GOBAR_DD31138 [Gossypium barbadense]